MGFGQVVEYGHVPAFAAYQDRFVIEAVADSRKERLARAAEIYPRARRYSGIAELLAAEKKLDFVDIATPPVMHPEHAMMVLSAGCHVLCEKPLALTREDFVEIQDKSRGAGLCVFTVHNWKKAPPILKVKEILEGGTAGNPEHAQLHVLRQKPASSAASVQGWRQDPALSGGGILVDHGWHNFYLLRHLMGQDPVAVTARLAFPAQGPAGPHSAPEDLAAVWVDFPSGTGVVYLSWRSPVRKNSGMVHAAGGLIEIRDDDVIFEAPGRPVETIRTGEKLSAGSAHPAWMTLLLPEFFEEVSVPAKRGANLAEAGVCVKLLTAAYRSHSSGGETVSV